MQAWAQTVPLAPGPLLAIIEDTTGSGKTEAALILAHRLMAEGRAHGLFFALPTMATADAMLPVSAPATGACVLPGSRPSLGLAHGQARLHEGFRELDPRDAGTSDEIGEEEAEPAGPSCAAWIADDRRKAFLAEIGAGTVDQALLAALPIRHAALRLLGLSRRVLIVDEVHAYHPYMRAELCGLLRFQAALGGSAILLSATLPQAMKRDLAEAFQCGGRASLVALAYPLATLVGAGRMTEHAVAVRAEAVRRLPVRRLETVEQAAEAVRAASATGAAVAWIRNTVDDAILAHAMLRDCGPATLLFHARFALCDRAPLEQEVLRRFGRNSAGRSGIVVATQVIEQSLDLDFDLIVTDLAPIDLLI